jgi:hypothetical protein
MMTPVEPKRARQTCFEFGDGDPQVVLRRRLFRRQYPLHDGRRTLSSVLSLARIACWMARQVSSVVRGIGVVPAR